MYFHSGFHFRKHMFFFPLYLRMSPSFQSAKVTREQKRSNFILKAFFCCFISHYLILQPGLLFSERKGTNTQCDSRGISVGAAFLDPVSSNLAGIFCTARKTHEWHLSQYWQIYASRKRQNWNGSAEGHKNGNRKDSGMKYIGQ